MNIFYIFPRECKILLTSDKEIRFVEGKLFLKHNTNKFL